MAVETTLYRENIAELTLYRRICAKYHRIFYIQKHHLKVNIFSNLKHQKVLNPLRFSNIFLSC